VPSEYRKQELLALLGNCVITLALGDEMSVLALAREASKQHVVELDRDYPGWKTELK
jgi:hypothetical protein